MKVHEVSSATSRDRCEEGAGVQVSTQLLQSTPRPSWSPVTPCLHVPGHSGSAPRVHRRSFLGASTSQTWSLCEFIGCKRKVESTGSDLGALRIPAPPNSPGPGAPQWLEQSWDQRTKARGWGCASLLGQLDLASGTAASVAWEQPVALILRQEQGGGGGGSPQVGLSKHLLWDSPKRQRPSKTPRVSWLWNLPSVFRGTLRCVSPGQ